MLDSESSKPLVRWNIFSVFVDFLFLFICSRLLSVTSLLSLQSHLKRHSPSALSASCACILLFFFRGTTTPLVVCQGLRIIEALRSHLNTLHLVGLLWASDQPDAETSTWQHSIYKRQSSMPPTGFEPTIPAGKQLQTHALDCTATGISRVLEYYLNIIFTGELREQQQWLVRNALWHHVVYCELMGNKEIKRTINDFLIFMEAIALCSLLK
jgi:hypothetical protein